MTFPTTLPEWVTLLSNPLFGAFIVFMVFRTLNRRDAPVLFGRANLSIINWADFSKIAFAWVLTLLWSGVVSLLNKDFAANAFLDVLPLVLARTTVVWGGNQAVYATLTKFLGPVGSKLLGGGTVSPGDLLGDMLTPGSAPVIESAKG